MPVSLSRFDTFERAAPPAFDSNAVILFAALATVPLVLILLLIAFCQNGMLSIDQVNAAFTNVS
jgi:hypothetical protein